jgi:hypothetical protein
MRTISEQTADRSAEALSWSSRKLGLSRVLAGILVFALLQNTVQAVHLAWDPSPDASVSGYAVYYGTNSGSYQTRNNVGSQTNSIIQVPTNGATYFFVVTAYTVDGVESLPSNEVSYTAPEGLPTVQLRVTPTRQFILTVTGQVGRTYNIQTSPDLITWSVIGSVIVPAGGLLDFTDTNTTSFPKRFYRAQ